jgi:hypothetical protein
MRTFLWILVFTGTFGGAACSNDKPPPVDAAVEHIVPADLGQVCGPPSGCYTVSSQFGGQCQERCVSLGQWNAICTTNCITDVHCGPGAPHCTDYGSGGLRFCMAQTGNPNAGCTLPDAAADAPID